MHVHVGPMRLAVGSSSWNKCMCFLVLVMWTKICIWFTSCGYHFSFLLTCLFLPSLISLYIHLLFYLIHISLLLYIYTPFPPHSSLTFNSPLSLPNTLHFNFFLSLSLLSMGTKIISLTSIVLFAFFGFCLRGAYGDYGGWQTAHATFYGGGDASGTMGTLNSWNRHFFFTLHDLSCYKLCHVN